MKRVALTVASLLLTTAAHATPSCDFYAMAGSFSVRANGVAHINRIGARMTFGNTEIPAFSPGLWHAYVGPFDTEYAAGRAVPRLRATGVYDAYVKADCGE